MSCEFRILDYNYAFEPTVALSASSEDVNFPVTNLRRFLRSSVWRSGGNFTITTLNQKLDFKHNGGAELTAVIPVGDYTYTELEAEIESQMEAEAGAAVFTVQYLTGSGLWNIVSSGASLQLLFLTGSNSSSSIRSAIGFSNEDYTGSLDYTGPVVSIHTNEWVLVDLQTEEAIDSFCMFAELGGSFGFSSAAVIKIEANATTNFSSPAVSETVTANSDNNTICHFFASSQFFRYWRISIVDSRNPNLFVEIPKVFLSLATQLTQNPDVGFTDLLDDNSKIVKTPYGHRYSDIYPTARSLEFNYNSLPEADVSSIQSIYKANGGVSPVVLALDPLEELWDKERFCVFGYLKQQVKVQQQFYTYFGTQISLEEGA